MVPGTADDRTGLSSRLPIAGRVVVLDGLTRYRGRKRAGLPVSRQATGSTWGAQRAVVDEVVASLITNRA